MDPKEILLVLQKICSEVTGVDPSEVTMGSDLREDIGASDLEIAEIVTRVEQEFEILLPQSEMKRLMGINHPVMVGQIIELILEEM